VEKKCESVAFPLISAGVYGYPKDKALRVAMDVITEFLLEHEMLVYVVIFDKASYQISEKLFADIQAYIDDNYVESHLDFRYERMREAQCSQILEADIPTEVFESALPPQDVDEALTWEESDKAQHPFRSSRADIPVWGITHSLKASPLRSAAPTTSASITLEDAVNQIDESFSQMLLRKIDEKGMTDAECYKKANVDRKLFSKIRSDIHYRPSKVTAIAFAIALELSLDEAKDMLMKAGFALSRSNKFDIIIEFFITNGNYNIMEINEALFAFDQSLLGT